MESHTRAASLPAPQTCRVIGKRRRIIDLSDTEEQEEVKRASSVIPSTTGDNGTSSTHHHTLRKEETTANSQNKTARDKRKRRKKRRKVSIVQEPSQPEKVEPEASQIASGSGLRRSPSLLSTIEIPDAVLGRTSGPIVVPTSADSSTDVAPTSFEVAESSRNATETVVKAESQSHSGEVGGHDPLPAEPIIPLPVLNPVDSNESLRNKNLAAELEVHKTLLNSMLPPLTCQICLFLMHRPFALAPCGHTACHTCLVSWFSSHPAQEGQAPAPAVPNAQVPANPLPNDIVDNNNANPQNAPLPPADLRAIMRRKKTCPHCRAIVRERPAEVWAIKDMVLNVVKSGLIDNELVPPTLQHELDTGEEVRGDPWTNIFPSARSVPLDGFQGLDEREHMGIIDLEDGGVYRCIDCAHEIEDGICTGCERIYPGHGWGSDSESDDEVFPYNLPRVVWRGPGSFFGDNWRDIDIDDVGGDTEVEENEDVEVGLEIDSDDSDDDDESDSSENSFIVGDDTDVEIGDGPHNAGRGYRNNQPPIRWVISSDDETMDGHDLHDDEVVELRVPSRASRVSRIVISSDSGSDQESEYDIQDLAAERAARDRVLYGDDGSLPTRVNRYASDDDVSDYLSTSDRYASEGGGSSRSGIHSDEDGW